MKTVRASNNSGVALVTTVIVIAVLAVVAVAFMQSTSTDRLSSRTVANYYKARLAAEAGLAEAMALIHQNAQSFTYMSGSELQGGSYRTFIQTVTGDSGVWEINGDRVYLDSGAATDAPASLVVAGSLEEPQLVRNVAWMAMPLDNPGPNESVRYAFWVDDAGSKQNLEWWGGGGGQRGVITNLANVPLVLPDPGGQQASPFPDAALSALQGLRAPQASLFSLDGASFVGVRSGLVLPTVDTFKLVAPSVATTQGFNRYHFTMHSASGATAPSGQPKLNFEALRQHVNNLSSDQGPNSPKARLVEELLKDEPEGAEAWQGGSLSWLAKTQKYTEAEQKQIVANIIDYLDDDLIPTTDSVDDPTYLGVEYRLTADGRVQGHPYINMAGFGSAFNWSSATNSPGELNSTLLLSFLGIVNPWSSEIELGNYKPEIEFAIEGTVENGTLGDQAENYFVTDFDFDPGNSENNAPPSGRLPPATGRTYPGAASGNNYAARYNILGENNERQPADIVFNDIVYRPAKFRLLFTDSSGREGYVQILSQNLRVTMRPQTVTSPGVGGSRVYKFTRADSSQQEDLHLASDPRSNFTDVAWTNARSSGGNSTDIPRPNPEVDIMANVGPDYDGPQGMSTGSTWYTSQQVTNHFGRLSREGMESIGELGYIWTGKSWQTVNLHAVDDPATADWNLMDYVTAGHSVGAGSGGLISPVLPLRRAVNDINSSLMAALVEGGGFNINTRKAPTVTAVVTNAPNLSATAANILMSSEPGAFASAYGQIANLITESDGIVETGSDTKFGKESVQRALANIAVNHSRIFTVYSVGEYRMGGNVARAQLEADVFVGVDPQTGSAIIQIINQRFL